MGRAAKASLLSIYSNKGRLKLGYDIYKWCKSKAEKSESDKAYIRIYNTVFGIGLGYALIMVIILAICIPAALFSIEGGTMRRDGDKRSAHVTGDTVWYIDNTKQEVSLAELGLTSSDVVDGDTFTIYTDKRSHEILSVVTKEESDSGTRVGARILIPLLVIILISAIIISVITVRMRRNKLFKDAIREYGHVYNIDVKEFVEEQKFILFDKSFPLWLRIVVLIAAILLALSIK